MNPLDAVWEIAYTGSGFFWKAFWALALGYALSAAIQVFARRGETAKHLGEPRPRQVALAMVLGFASSSCSFAALSATRSLFAKGAALISALAFMFASTNLAVEVAALAFIFLGWQYSAALFVGAPILVATMAVIVTVTRPKTLERSARHHAQHAEGHEMDPSQGLPDSFRGRLGSRKAWHRVGRAYVGEWRMVWKELLVGFSIAGAIAALVPKAFFEAIFPTGWSIWLLVPVQALLAPVLAVLTFIGSMGNGPVAAILADHGVVFGAIMAFLYADFVVPPALKINARYYGWRFAAYLGLVFAASAVLAGIAVHALFAAIGPAPHGGKDIGEITTFAIDYTFFLNLVALAAAATLGVLSHQRREHEQETGEIRQAH